MDGGEQHNLTAVSNYFFTGKRQVGVGEKPRIIFVFSSPGAGKSTRIKPLLEESFATKPALLEIDELKAFIPENDTNKVQTADRWFNRILEEAVNLRYNLIVFRQRNMLMPQQTRKILQQAQKNGYQTEVCIVALDKKRSRLGMIHRYEFALDNQQQSGKTDIENYPRKPDFLCHYIFFKALPIITKMSEKSSLVDKVDVYDRDGKHLAFLDKLKKLKSKDTPLRALLKERHRAWLQHDCSKFDRRRKEVIEKMKKRGAKTWEFIRFRFLTNTFKNR